MAVAEYAKSHSTGGGSCATGQVGSVCTLSFARVAALAVLVIGATLSGSAYAQNLGSKIKFGSTGNNDDAVAVGEASIAIGSLSQARGNQSIAIGGSKPHNGSGRNSHVGSHAQGHESIAIGGDVLAEGPASIAIGSDDLYLMDDTRIKHKLSDHVKRLIQRHPVLQNLTNQYRRTRAQGHASTAVGAMAYAKGHFSNAFGTRATAESDYSLAVGLTSQATGEYSIAIGSNAYTSQDGGVALGGNAKVAVSKGIALGFDSQVTAGDNQRNAYIPRAIDIDPQIPQRHQATSGIGPLSIGSNSIKRKIINVGAGSQDTDAVNVA
ncbi:adhesin, partial [Moraxella catarrhalis]|nr:adhesin [Moraxella catarrhalis]